MHEIVQGSEASGVMFGGQQGSLVQSLSILTRKAIQAVEKVQVVFGGQQDSNQSSQKICIHARMSVKTALKQYKFTGSEGRLEPTECDKCGLQGQACKGEWGFY